MVQIKHPKVFTEPDPISTCWTEEMICPYCGAKQSDEDYRDDEEWECQICERKFDVFAEYEKLYVTNKKKRR